MSRFFKRGESLEGELRAARRRWFRVAVPVALTAVMVGALAAVGGVGYAATNVEGAVKAVSHVFVPAKAQQAVVVEGLTSGGDQYKDGYGWGDDKHNHTGPPGLHEGKKGKKKGQFTPPLIAQIVGKTATVSTNVTIDEQAHLFISVIDKATGKQLLIAQSKSKVGKTLKGDQAKSVNYLVLVPRTIPLKVAVPASLLQAGHTYAIRVIARDPQGNKTNLLIPFHG